MWSDLIIILFLVFMWCWDYPADHPAKRFITKFSFPFIYMGFWHGWAMFAPEPIHVNRRMCLAFMRWSYLFRPVGSIWCL